MSLSQAAEYFVSPTGGADGTGTAEAPFGSLKAAQAAILASEPGPGQEPITVWIKGGRYPVTETLELGKEIAGTSENPIVFRAIEGEVPVFDAGLALGLERTEWAKSPEVEARLAPAAKGKVMALRITDPRVSKLLESASVRCSIDGRMMTLSKYPNVGFGHIDRILDKGAVYAHGRTKGAPPKWSLEKPIGGSFTVLDKDVSAWERELTTKNKLRIAGYLAYDWYRQAHPVASVKDGVVRLANDSRYGIIKKEKLPRRLIASNLLCELDAPGEFYFDGDEHTLYFIPPVELNPDSMLSVWGGPGFARFAGATHVSMQGLVIEGVGVGKAAVLVESGERILLAGCTIRNSSRPAAVISGGKQNGLLSCDIYDVPHHVTLDGGNVRKLESAGNFAINCHFTQVEASDYYGRIQVRGVGHVFRHNLIHNCPGQIMVFGDCDHRIEHNEIFNIGYEEGDGGAIYSGASRWSWGNKLRYNFLHHLMCLPQAHPRGGIYPDDGDQGETIEGNVFYKAAHRAVLINGGAGHTVRGNLFLNGYIGIYNTEAYSERGYKDIARYDSGELKRGDKGDQIWRTEQVIGEKGWNQEPWSSRFPRFRKIMNQDRMRFYPIECEYIGNRFHGNWRDIEHRIGSGEKGVKDVGKVEFIRTADNGEISMAVFRNPSTLDFTYRSATPSLPETKFAEAGLRRDSYRSRIPDKARYRSAVREHFKDRPSFDPKAVYDPKTVNQKVYFNSGRLLLENGGMMH
ncbi:MAG: right-handed parallel beta-helix repeat-containing protein [Verrucomicrobiota bacterium]